MDEQRQNREILGKDPAAEMLATIQKGAAPLIKLPWVEVVQEIVQNTGVIMKQNAKLAPDQQSKTFLLPAAAFMLAAYRVLSKIIPDREKVIRILADAVAGQWSDVEGHLRRRLGITQDDPEKAYEMCRVNFKKIGDEQFGCTYMFEQESSGERESFIRAFRFISLPHLPLDGSRKETALSSFLRRQSTRSSAWVDLPEPSIPSRTTRIPFLKLMIY